MRSHFSRSGSNKAFGPRRRAGHHVPKWERWWKDYSQFITRHRGLGDESHRAARYFVRDFLSWRFRRGEARWAQVGIKDIWSYGERCAQRLKPRSANLGLSIIRRFLRFVQMHGACSPELAQAVPHVATFGQSIQPAVLTDQQRRALLAAFTQRSSNACRDYTMALCMVDLGLRSIEVARLCLSDIDWARKLLLVPATKTGRGRQLPLPRHIAAALHAYISTRPATDCDRLFVGHHFRRGEPVSTAAIRGAMRAGYRRCGFPRSWSGTHRLRHTFATRLFARGADLKHIADLLGHQSISTTNLYAQVDLNGLRALAQPWPV